MGGSGFSSNGITNGNNTTPVAYTGNNKGGVVALDGAYYIDWSAKATYTYHAGAWVNVGNGGTGNGWQQGGNAFAAPGIIGTTDAQPISMIAHGNVLLTSADASNNVVLKAPTGLGQELHLQADSQMYFDIGGNQVVGIGGGTLQLMGNSIEMADGDINDVNTIMGFFGQDLILQDGANTHSLNIGANGFNFDAGDLINVHTIETNNIANGGVPIVLLDNMNFNAKQLINCGLIGSTMGTDLVLRDGSADHQLNIQSTGFNFNTGALFNANSLASTSGSDLQLKDGAATHALNIGTTGFYFNNGPLSGITSIAVPSIGNAGSAVVFTDNLNMNSHTVTGVTSLNVATIGHGGSAVTFSDNLAMGSHTITGVTTLATGGIGNGGSAVTYSDNIAMGGKNISGIGTLSASSSTLNVANNLNMEFFNVGSVGALGFGAGPIITTTTAVTTGVAAQTAYLTVSINGTSYKLLLAS